MRARARAACAQALALGASATKRREWAEATEHLRLALSLRPHAAPVWQHLAMCLLRANPPSPDEACDALRRAVSLEPTDAQSWALLGSQLLDTPGREAEARSALGRASELMPTDALLAGRHVRACCGARDLERARGTMARTHALGLALPRSALRRVFVALGGDGDGPASCPNRFAPSGDLSADARALAAAAAAAAERRLGADDVGDVEALGMAVFFAQLCADVPAEARWREARLAALHTAGTWLGDARALGTHVEECAQLLQVLERLGAPRARIVALRGTLHDVFERARDALGASAGYEELAMLRAAVRRHVGSASDDSDDSDDA